MMKKTMSPEQSENLAYDIILYLQKWGMWRDISIYTGGKRYTDCDVSDGDGFRGLTGVKVSDAPNPEEYTTGYIEGYEGKEGKWISFSNPEHLLDMTFEGAFYLLLNFLEYSVETDDLSEEAKKYIVYHDEDFLCDAYDYLNIRDGWDPMEFDSYDEYLELNEYSEPEYDDRVFNNEPREFSTAEEYNEYLEKTTASKEESLLKWVYDKNFDSIFKQHTYYEEYSNNGEIADHILSEFDKILEKHGLWYENGFRWTLTAYWI